MSILYEIGPLPERVEIQWRLHGLDDDGDAVAICRMTARRDEAVQRLNPLVAANATFAGILRTATSLLLYDDITDDDGDVIPDDEPYLVVPNDPEFWQDVYTTVLGLERRD